jgi:dCMP deaminase
MRKSWDEYFMDIAFQVAGRSTCSRLQVGSVLVKNKRIKATGYNGSPRGLNHCTDKGCHMKDNHCIRTIHSEVNCLLEAAPEEREDATLYVTHRPCPECQKLIITCGIERVVYCIDYTPHTDWFSESTHIEVIQLPRSNKNEALSE